MTHTTTPQPASPQELFAAYEQQNQIKDEVYQRYQTLAAPAREAFDAWMAAIDRSHELYQAYERSRELGTSGT